MMTSTAADQPDAPGLVFALIGPVYPFRGGIAHYTTSLARALRAAHHTVLLVSFKRQYPQRLFPGRSDRDPSQQPFTADDPQYWIDSLNPFTWMATFFRIRAAHPDVLVLQWWTPFWTLVWLALLVANRLLLNSRVCIICHNVLPHETRPWSQWATRLVLGWADRLIVQSGAEAQRASRLLPGKPIFVVPHPAYDMFVSQSVDKKQARERLHLAATAPVLLFFGIVRAYKGLGRLLGALPVIRRELPDVTLVIAGEFWDDERAYRTMIDDMGLHDAVIIDNRYIPNEEVAIYFSAADLLVAPYEQITGSGVVSMAQGFGLPAVTTDGKGQASLLLGGALAGAEVQKVNGLAAAIVEALRQVAAQRAVSSPTRTADPWRALVDVLANTPSARPGAPHQDHAETLIAQPLDAAAHTREVSGDDPCVY